MKNNLNESKESVAARPAGQAQVTVETGTTILRFSVNPKTGRPRLRESLTREGAPAPFLVYTDGEVSYVSIPMERGGRFSVTASVTPGEPATTPPSGRLATAPSAGACGEEEGPAPPIIFSDYDG